MNTSRPAIVRSNIKTILSALPGLSASKVKLGLIDKDPSDEFFEDLAHSGYFVKISPATQDSYSHGENVSEFHIEVVFYFPIPNKTNFDFLAEEDMAFKTIRNALGLPANYPTSAPPKNIELDGPEIMPDLANPSGMYKYKLSFYGD